MLLLWMCMCVCACVARACNDGSRWSVLIDVCSLVRPEGIGAGWASHPLKIHTGIPFGGCNVSVYVCGVCGSVCVCARLCDATADRRAGGYYWPEGCYRDQWCQRGATSVDCLFVNTGFPLFACDFSLFTSLLWFKHQSLEKMNLDDIL